MTELYSKTTSEKQKVKFQLRRRFDGVTWLDFFSFPLKVLFLDKMCISHTPTACCFNYFNFEKKLVKRLPKFKFYLHPLLNYLTIKIFNPFFLSSVITCKHLFVSWTFIGFLLGTEFSTWMRNSNDQSKVPFPYGSSTYSYSGSKSTVNAWRCQCCVICLCTCVGIWCSKQSKYIRSVPLVLNSLRLLPILR